MKDEETRLALELAKLKKMTNEEFIVKLMNFHPSGALIQGFVVEALRFYSRIVALGDPAEFKGNQFIDEGAWRAIGIDVYKQLYMKYGNENDEGTKKDFKTIAEIDAREAAKVPKEETPAKERPKYEH